MREIYNKEINRRPALSVYDSQADQISRKVNNEFVQAQTEDR
tara:strand:- start:213 stop:338 length:126 start_codon:yes stop_codon:yes gene_type:complete